MEEIPLPEIERYRQMEPAMLVRRVRCRQGGCGAWYWITAGACSAAAS